MKTDRRSDIGNLDIPKFQLLFCTLNTHTILFVYKISNIPPLTDLKQAISLFNSKSGCSITQMIWSQLTLISFYTLWAYYMARESARTPKTNDFLCRRNNIGVALWPNMAALQTHAREEVGLLHLETNHTSRSPKRECGWAWTCTALA